MNGSIRQCRTRRQLIAEDHIHVMVIDEHRDFGSCFSVSALARVFRGVRVSRLALTAAGTAVLRTALLFVMPESRSFRPFAA